MELHGIRTCVSIWRRDGDMRMYWLGWSNSNNPFSSHIGGFPLIFCAATATTTRGTKYKRGINCHMLVEGLKEALQMEPLLCMVPQMRGNLGEHSQWHPYG